MTIVRKRRVTLVIVVVVVVVMVVVILPRFSKREISVVAVVVLVVVAAPVPIKEVVVVESKVLVVLGKDEGVCSLVCKDYFGFLLYHLCLSVSAYIVHIPPFFKFIIIILLSLGLLSHQSLHLIVMSEVEKSEAASDSNSKK